MEDIYSIIENIDSSKYDELDSTEDVYYSNSKIYEQQKKLINFKIILDKFYKV